MNKTNQHIVLIGIGNQPQPEFSKEVLRLILQHQVFSGGKRHYELVKDFLPKNSTWIQISGGMDCLISNYKEINLPIVVFASGDPLFYGFGNTLQRLYTEASLEVYPYFNSIQRLCHKTQTNYNFLKSVSVHGRDWTALDVALMQQENLIGVLTDRFKNPSAIAKRMLQYNFRNYTIMVGEALDGKEEQIFSLSLEEAVQQEFNPLNCVLLVKTEIKPKLLGKPDIKFHHLPNRANMMTKMPIRLTTLSVLNLKEKEVFWDIGACTGAVAIEAKAYEPSLQVFAFEKRIVCGDIIQKNKEQFGTPGIEIIIDDFFELNLNAYPKPEVVFIGGHGGRLSEMIEKLLQINPKVRMVTNAVQESTSSVFLKELSAKGFEIETIQIKVNEHNTIRIHSAKTEN